MVDQADTVDLTIENITQEANIGFLGLQAAQLLIQTGTANFLVEQDGSVVVANPTRVFVDYTAMQPPPGKVAVRVRPVLLEGRPQHVAMMSDGTIWEVDYVDPEDLENVDAEEEESPQ